MRTVRCDGSPARVAELAGALEAALGGGPAVLPLGPQGSPSPAPTAKPGDGVAAVVATSGSNGEPKLVELPAASLRASAAATEARLGGSARWLLALPAEHVAGVQVLVRALLAGAAPVSQDLRGGFRPDDFATATARLGGARRHTSLVPTQLLRLLDAGGAPLDALRGYAAVLVGGAALDPALRARAQAAGVRLVATYGMTETCGGCVYDGVPLDGVRVEVLLDDDTAALDGVPPGPAAGHGTSACSGPDDDGPGRTIAPTRARVRPDSRAGGLSAGRVAVSGVTLARGYLGRPAETAVAFAGGWFRTGDLGRMGADGLLDVLGRADDVIVTGGEKVAPAAVERALAAQPGVRAACVVGLPDPEWGQVVAAAVVVAHPGAAPGHERLRAAVRAALGRAAVPRRLLDLPALPLRGIGKPDRAAVTQLLSEIHSDE